MNETIEKKITEWMNPPFDEDTVSEISRLVYEKKENELTDRFYRKLEFGTGGLRGITGAGTNRMNIYTVGMASQGLSEYIIQKGSPEAGVVIARDSRNMSSEFAREAAMVLAGNGIKVYFFEDITPTPMCSFAVRETGSCAGIVITASHNPPEYNGYKVYWSDGGQIVPPHDKNIIAMVEKITGIDQIRKIPFEEGISSGIINIIRHEMTDRYLSRLLKVLPAVSSGKDLKIIYSPLHGSGYRIVPEAMKSAGFDNVIQEPAQSVPDGKFPTVKSPNPEDPSAMERSIALAEASGADLVLATDPDSDRMGVGFPGPDGKFMLINGNQAGVMLEYFILSRMKADGSLPAEGAVVKTIVTSDLQQAVAESFGCHMDNVLTGFKWIADKMKLYEETGSHVFIFGGEESYGYLPVSFVRDKDAISSCCFFAVMAAWIRSQGRTMYDFLQEIYLKFGFYREGLLSLTMKGIDGQEKIAAIMKRFRENPPAAINGSETAEIRDFKTGTKTVKGKVLPMKGLPSSDVLQFLLADGTLATVRPSGTEPKIKFYISVHSRADKATADSVIKTLDEKVEAIKQALERLTV